MIVFLLIVALAGAFVLALLWRSAHNRAAFFRENAERMEQEVNIRGHSIAALRKQVTSLTDELGDADDARTAAHDRLKLAAEMHATRVSGLEAGIESLSIECEAARLEAARLKMIFEKCRKLFAESNS